MCKKQKAKLSLFGRPKNTKMMLVMMVLIADEEDEEVEQACRNFGRFYAYLIFVKTITTAGCVNNFAKCKTF